MELARNIRVKIGNSLLRKKILKTSRKVSYQGIGHVRRIGIVWDATRVNDFINLSRFYQKMNERNIEVTILGYFPEKNLPDQYTAIKFLNCIRRDEINFFYLPVSPESESFIRDRFDVLIDINFTGIFPLRCLSSLSNAAFKIGLFDSRNDGIIFDMMMDIKKPVETNYYLEQIMLYLEMIDPGKTEIVN